MKKILKSFQKFMKAHYKILIKVMIYFNNIIGITLLIAEQFFKYLRSKYKWLCSLFPNTKFESINKFNNVHNPFFNKNLQQYLKNTWWKTLVLWGNVVPQIRERSRRTTATIEVENKIIKHHDIKEHNLDLDKYYMRELKCSKLTNC